MKIDMKIFYFLFLFFFSTVLLHAGVNLGDTTLLPTVQYNKKELKKEMNDVKALDKQFKVWQKAIKQKNIDYLNVVFSNTMKQLEKENSELSNRVSERSKKMIPPDAQKKATSTGVEDKPQVYNSELKEQIVHVNKQDIMRKKAEAEYLNKYINVIRNEKTLINKLKNVKTFDGQTPPSTYEQISADIMAFKKEMNREITLMEKETGKK